MGEGKKSALNVLEADGTMKVEGNIEGQVNYEFAGYATAGNTFKVSVKATNQELAFTVGLASPGHISVKTAGAVESDVQMDFHAYHIFDVLKTLP